MLIFYSTSSTAKIGFSYLSNQLAGAMMYTALGMNNLKVDTQHGYISLNNTL